MVRSTYGIGPQFYNVDRQLKNAPRARLVIYTAAVRLGALVMEAPATDARAITGAVLNTALRSTSTGTECTGNTTPRSRVSETRMCGAIPSRSTSGPAAKAREDQGFANGDGVLIYPGEENSTPRRSRHRGAVLDN